MGGTPSLVYKSLCRWHEPERHGALHSLTKGLIHVSRKQVQKTTPPHASAPTMQESHAKADSYKPCCSFFYVSYFQSVTKSCLFLQLNVFKYETPLNF